MHEKSVALLNAAIADELTAVHQYMYFHFRCDDMGLDLLSGLFRRTAIEEMLHIERLAERVLFIKGEVEMKASSEVQKIHNVKDMLDMACKLEEGAITMYNTFANQCAGHADSMSKKLFEDLTMDEERHYDQFDTELGNLGQYGDSYLALQSIERSKTLAAAPPPTAPQA